jgi:hypothetical protein
MGKMVMTYSIHSCAYAERAAARLGEETKEGLFYAALELRCGIEARMREYLADWEHVSKKQKEGWRVAALGRALDETFYLGDRVARFSLVDDRSGEDLCSLYYTPVSSALQKAGERLGDLLHAVREQRNDNDPWWEEARAFLQEVLSELRWANSGELLGAPLLDSMGRLVVEATVGTEHPMRRIVSAGVGSTIRVEYIDRTPPSLHGPTQGGSPATPPPSGDREKRDAI